MVDLRSMVIFSASSWSIAIVVLCLTVIIGIYHARRFRLYRMAMAFPGPLALPIIGNALMFWGDEKAIADRLRSLSEFYPSAFRVWIGPFLHILIKDPKQLQAVLHNESILGKSEIYQFAEPWVGTGIVTAAVPKWRVHRNLIAPAFNASFLKNFIEIFSEQSEILADQFGKRVDGPEFAVSELVSLCTLDMILESAMGVKLKAQTEKYSDYHEAVKKLGNLVCQRGLKIWLYPDFIFNRTAVGKEHNACVEHIHSFGKSIIKTKKEILRMKSQLDIDTANEVDDADSQRKSLLDVYLELADGGKKLSDEEVREEVDTVVIAGHDTVANTISFLLLMLASHPEVQERVYRELCEIYPTDEDMKRGVTLEDTCRMSYLDRAIKETMRLYPAIPIMSRTVSEDVDLGDCVVARGSSITIAILHIHRNERFWEDPLTFDPDRFLPEAIAKRDSYTYIPFSRGPRGCMGSKYAMVAVKVAAATMLRRYALKKDNIIPVRDIELEMNIFIKAVKPLTLRVERRRPRT